MPARGIHPRGARSVHPSGRGELLLWLNSLCSTGYPSVESLRDGAAYCSIIEAAANRVSANCVKAQSHEAAAAGVRSRRASQLLGRVDWDTTIATCNLSANANKDSRQLRMSCERNFQVLQQMLRSCVPAEFELELDVTRLAEGKLQDHIRLLQWLYNFMSKLLLQYSVEAIAARAAPHGPADNQDGAPEVQHQLHAVGGTTASAAGVQPRSASADAPRRPPHSERLDATTDAQEGGRAGRARERKSSSQSTPCGTTPGRIASHQSNEEVVWGSSEGRSRSQRKEGMTSPDQRQARHQRSSDSLRRPHNASYTPVSRSSRTGTTPVLRGDLSGTSGDDGEGQDRDDGSASFNVSPVDTAGYASVDPALLALRDEVEGFEAVVLDAQQAHQNQLTPLSSVAHHPGKAAATGSSTLTLSELGAMLERRDTLWQALDAIYTAILEAQRRSSRWSTAQDGIGPSTPHLLLNDLAPMFQLQPLQE